MVLDNRGKRNVSTAASDVAAQSGSAVRGDRLRWIFFRCLQILDLCAGMLECNFLV